MTNTKLRGDNSINIQGRITVLVHSTFSHCNLSINQVSSNNYEKWLRGDNTVHIQGRIMVLVHSTKFNLNGNSSFKVICRTRYCDGQTDGKSLRLRKSQQSVLLHATYLR